jgi:hypothetical protein
MSEVQMAVSPAAGAHLTLPRQRPVSKAPANVTIGLAAYERRAFGSYQTTTEMVLQITDV